MKEQECRFCCISNQQYFYEDIDRPFIDNDKYMAVASIGALIEGWTLIIPKGHQVSMANQYGDEAFKEFANETICRLTSKYGPLIAFEHGSNKKGSMTGCGTDHAHLHMVPFKSLLPDLRSSGLYWEPCRASEVAQKSGKSEYLFYADVGINGWDDQIGCIHVLESPISQYFRKLLAHKIGCSSMSDYRIFPFLNNARNTSESMTKDLVGV